MKDSYEAKIRLQEIFRKIRMSVAVDFRKPQHTRSSCQCCYASNVSRCRRYHYAIRKSSETIQHTRESCRRRNRSRRCHSYRQSTSIHRREIFHLVHAPCFHRFSACIASRFRRYRVCVKITLHRAISFTASQMVCFHYYSFTFYAIWGLQFL